MSTKAYKIKRYVCACEKITEDQLVELIEQRQLTDLVEVKKAAGVAIGCGCCQMAIKMVMDRNQISLAINAARAK